MTLEELKTFEKWLMEAYESRPAVPFTILAQALKAVRASVRLNATK